MSRPLATIETFDEKTESDIPVTERNIDLSVKSDRDWLYKHTMWALNNGHSVVATPVME